MKTSVKVCIGMTIVLSFNVLAEITWLGASYLSGGTARATSRISAERTDEIDALYAYAQIVENSWNVYSAENTCLATGSWPLECVATAMKPFATWGCEYCGSGLVRALRYNPNQTAFEDEWGEYCALCYDQQGCEDF